MESEESPDYWFKTAAFALTQLYKHSSTSHPQSTSQHQQDQQHHFRSGYEQALTDLTRHLQSLQHTNARIDDHQTWISLSDLLIYIQHHPIHASVPSSPLLQNLHGPVGSSELHQHQRAQSQPQSQAPRRAVDTKESSTQTEWHDLMDDTVLGVQRKRTRLDQQQNYAFSTDLIQYASNSSLGTQ